MLNNNEEISFEQVNVAPEQQTVAPQPQPQQPAPVAEQTMQMAPQEEVAFQPIDATPMQQAQPAMQAQVMPTMQPVDQGFTVVDAPMETMGTFDPNAGALPVVETEVIDLSSLMVGTESMDPAETQYRKLPEGTHYVKFDEMEFASTKAGKPIIWIRYKAVNGVDEGTMLSESYYLGGTEKWQVETSIGHLKHRLEVDFGLTNLPWQSGSFDIVSQTVNAAATQLHFNATITYPIDKTTKEPSDFARIENIIKA